MAKPPQPSEYQTKIVKRFRGISQYRNITAVPMENALDLMNVIVAASGELQKLRFPVVLADDPFGGSIIDKFIDFQQGNGTRQLVYNDLERLGFFTGDVYPFASTVIDTNPLYNRRWGFVVSNNLLLMANGNKALAWDGTRLMPWGIPKPAAPATIGIIQPVVTMSRAANITTVAGGSTDHLGYCNPVVGDPFSITGCSDPSFNGNWKVKTANDNAGSFTFDNAGPNVGAVGAPKGNITTYYTFLDGTKNINFAGTGYSRLNNVATIIFANNFVLIKGDLVNITAAGDASFNGLQQVIVGTTNSISYANFGPDVAAPTAPSPQIQGGFTDTVGGKTWRYAYKDSITGTEGVASDSVGPIPTAQGVLNFAATYLTPTAPPIARVDTIVWYSTLDGGGDYFLEAEVPLASNGGAIFSHANDLSLDSSQRCSFINFQPPADARFLVKWQGRVFLAGMLSAPQDIVYTGYEKILRGRPEESVPPNNRIRLAIGADTLRGFGVLQNGVVAWDNSNGMFMFKGVAEDIVTTQPVNFSAYLETLPWQEGLSSHDSVQSTPYGVIWFGADKSVKVWNGIFYGEIIGPRNLSENIYPILADITPGTETSTQSAYFNWLDRSWYVLLVAIRGSLTPNRLLFFDLTKEVQDNLGVFISDIQAESIGVREDAKGGRHLLISQKGTIQELKVASTAINGVHHTLTPTTSQLYAFWESGMHGGDAPQMSLMYRFGRLVTDQDGFSLVVNVFDDRTSRVRDVSPWSVTKILDGTGGFSVNRKGRRSNVVIKFPTLDVDASVLEISYSALPLAEGLT